MTVFDTPNYDGQGLAQETGTRGRKIGFLEGISASWDYQHRDASMNAIGYSFENEMGEMNRKLVAAGEKPVKLIDDVKPTLPESATKPWFGVPGLYGIGQLQAMAGEYFVSNQKKNTSYSDIAEYFKNGGTPEMAAKIAAYDAEIEGLRKKHPDLPLMTAGETWNTVQEKAQAAKAVNDRTGWVGDIIGSGAASLDPRTDPLNFATTPIGGGGKTVLGRIGAQAFGQGAIQLVNELTGVQANKELLGLPTGAGDIAQSVGGAAIGGAAFQGLGEGVGALARRWFRSVPHDPAPAPADVVPAGNLPPPAVPHAVPGELAPTPAKPGFEAYISDQERFLKEAARTDGAPYGNTRAGHKKSVLDYNAADRQLSDWEGPNGIDVTPHTDTAPAPDITHFDYGQPYTKAMETRNYTVDEAARRVDPETFNVYDKLAAEAATLRARLGAERVSPEIAAKVSELDAKIEDIRVQLPDADPRARKRMLGEIAKLEKTRPPEDLTAKNTALVNDNARQRLMKVDEQMRDLAPVVSRAYGIAKDAWRHDVIDPDARAFLKDLEVRGRVRFRDNVAPFEPPRGPTLEEKAPIIAANREIIDKLPPNSDLADGVAAIFKEADKIVQDAQESTKAQIAKLIKPVAETEKVETSTQLRERFTDAKGVTDTNKAADTLAKEVETALAAGKKVTIFPEDKAVDIVAVSRGMMADAQGQRWGVLPLIMAKRESAGNPAIKIADNDGFLHLANGQKLDLNEEMELGVGEGLSGDAVSQKFSIRELLTALQKDDDILKGVGVCSVRKAI